MTTRKRDERVKNKGNNVKCNFVLEDEVQECRTKEDMGELGERTQNFPLLTRSKLGVCL